jgi:hypothetical protein
VLETCCYSALSGLTLAGSSPSFLMTLCGFQVSDGIDGTGARAVSRDIGWAPTNPIERDTELERGQARARVARLEPCSLDLSDQPCAIALRAIHQLPVHDAADDPSIFAREMVTSCGL